MRIRNACAALCCAAALIVAGCSGAQSGVVPASSSTGAAPTAKKGQLLIRIAVPRKHSTSHTAVRSGRKPHYVSVDTQALRITLTGPQSISVFIPLDPATNSECGENSSSQYECILEFGFPAGSYTGTIVAYDSTNQATANVISAAQSIPFTIVAGATTNVPLTLSGVPHSINLSANSIFTSSFETSFNIVGPGAVTYSVSALDVDGQTIVGPGSPSFQFSLSEPFTETSSGNTVTITPPPFFYTQPVALDVTASFAGLATVGCAQPGAACTAAFTFTQVPIVAVGNYAGENVALFAENSSSELDTISAGSGEVVSALGYDPAGRLDVATYPNAAVNAYALPNVNTPAATYTGFTEPSQIFAFGTDTFILDAGNGDVDAYPSGGSGSSPSLQFAPGSGSSYFIYDASGNLIVANSGGNTVKIYADGSTLPSATITTGVNEPLALAEYNNVLYVANHSSIAEYTAPFTTGMSPTRTIATGIDNAVNIAIDLNDPARIGDLFVANFNNNTVTQYAPGGTSPIATLSTGISDPRYLAFDGSGALFVLNDSNSPSVVEFTPGTSSPARTYSSGLSGADSLVVMP
jgi:hypothetical protein